MSLITIERVKFDGMHTRGYIQTKEGIFATLERPWIPGYPGGKPFESCVPDGEYHLRPHTRPNGDKVVALVNHDLGVYYQKHEVPEEGGRYLILIHAGNWVKDVVGCIAPGLRYIRSVQPMVQRSRPAMSEIMKTAPTRLIIESAKDA